MDEKGRCQARREVSTMRPISTQTAIWNTDTTTLRAKKESTE
jgi:hypothetical protein